MLVFGPNLTLLDLGTSTNWLFINLCNVSSYMYLIHMISNSFPNFVCRKHSLVNWFAWCMVSFTFHFLLATNSIKFLILCTTPRWFTLYNSDVNLRLTLFSHICLQNPSYLFIYFRLLFKKKNHIYCCWDFGNYISYQEWLHRKYQDKREEL